MKLGEAQRDSTRCWGALVACAMAMGLDLREKDCHRDYSKPRLKAAFTAPQSEGGLGSHPNSTHSKALARDADLFDLQDGHYLTDTESYRVLGEIWERLHPLARWGGRFGDGRHFSFEWEGIR